MIPKTIHDTSSSYASIDEEWRKYLLFLEKNNNDEYINILNEIHIPYIRKAYYILNEYKENNR